MVRVFLHIRADTAYWILFALNIFTIFSLKYFHYLGFVSDRFLCKINICCCKSFICERLQRK